MFPLNTTDYNQKPKEELFMFARKKSLAAVVIVTMIMAILGPLGGSVALAATNPELPRYYVDTTYSAPTGNTITLNSGGDLQAALDSAQLGDTIVLQAGATFTGNYTLPNKTSGSGWIYIRSSAYSSLPAQGQRVFPANAANMPKIVTPNNTSAITAAVGAHHYRLVGIEVDTTYSARTSGTALWNMIQLGSGSETSYSQFPHDITIDRCYIHASTNGNVRRGICLNGQYLGVVDSYISGIHELGGDSQALSVWSGPGPLKIVNCQLEATGENFLSGGSDNLITGLVPSDIEFRSNYLVKPLSWKEGDPSYCGIDWQNKNLFELKSARRVLVDGNIMENNWVDAQTGEAVLFTPRSQDGTNPWAAIQDITFTNNIVRHSAAAFNIMSDDDRNISQQLQRVMIKNNLLADIDGAK